jgi:hypothetical protein
VSRSWGGKLLGWSGSGKEEEGKVVGHVRNKLSHNQVRKDQLHNRMLDKSVLKFMKRA